MANLDALRQQMRDVEGRFAELLRQLPTDKEVPGLLEDITAIGKNAGLAELKRDGGGRRPPLGACPLPHSQMLGVAAVLLLIIGVSVWFYLPSQPEAVEADKGRVELPLDLPVVAVAPDGTETVIDVSYNFV